MATADFTIKQGDTAPALSNTLLDASGNAVDLTGATCRVHIFTSDLVTKVVDAPATIMQTGVSPTFTNKGLVQYAWQPADVLNSGAFYYEWEVFFADGTIESFPNYKNLLLKIVPALVVP